MAWHGRAGRGRARRGTARLGEAGQGRAWQGEVAEDGVKHGSLFAGIGGFDLGFERAGIETVWQVEIDEYCRRVLEKNFPAAKRYTDIRECCGYPYSKRWRHLSGHRKHHLQTVDIISGGFPCQDISIAGKRAGIDGERSGLWSEMCRIVRELRPRYVVVENVAALLAPVRRGGRLEQTAAMGRVLGDLAACGYDAEWQSIRACDVGAPHIRERIWIVAYPIGSRVREQSILGAECGGAPEPEHDREEMADATSSRCEGARRREAERTRTPCESERGLRLESGERGEDVADSAIFAERESFNEADTIAGSGKSRQILGGGSWWGVEPDVGRVAHGVPALVDRLRGLGNAIIPQIAEWIGRRIVDA